MIVGTQSTLARVNSASATHTLAWAPAALRAGCAASGPDPVAAGPSDSGAVGDPGRNGARSAPGASGCGSRANGDRGAGGWRRACFRGGLAAGDAGGGA